MKFKKPMTIVLPVVDISALISFPLPMLYARHPFIRSSLNSKLLSLLILGIFAVSRTGNVFVTASKHAIHEHPQFLHAR